jgi:outer membrane protein OmpA-like peptidoglycan-associated protein
MLRLTGFAFAGIALLLSVPAAAQHEIQQPKDKWQQPKEIQKPRDTWQQPGEIQVPKGIQAIRTEEEKCTRRFVIGADTLFEFDQATLTSDAEETLKALAPLLLEAVRAGAHPATVEGHTDAKGSDDYNQTLSEKRAQTVRDWLAAVGALPIDTPIQGWGERRPIAPNLKPDGSDDPAGRQKNRRVEVTLDLCKS